MHFQIELTLEQREALGVSIGDIIGLMNPLAAPALAGQPGISPHPFCNNAGILPRSMEGIYVEAVLARAGAAIGQNDNGLAKLILVEGQASLLGASAHWNLDPYGPDYAAFVAQRRLGTAYSFDRGVDVSIKHLAPPIRHRDPAHESPWDCNHRMVARHRRNSDTHDRA